MFRAFSTAATGMTAQQMTVDAIANNLANVNTVGFKRSQMDFQDLIYVTMAEPGREEAAGVPAPNGLEIGNGVRPASTLNRFNGSEEPKVSSLASSEPLYVLFPSNTTFATSARSTTTNVTITPSVV